MSGEAPQATTNISDEYTVSIFKVDSLHGIIKDKKGNIYIYIYTHTHTHIYILSSVFPPYRGEEVWVRQWSWELYQQ